MDLRVTIALGMMRSMIKEFDPDDVFARHLSDATVVRQSAALIANATDEEVMAAMADVKWETAHTVPMRSDGHKVSNPVVDAFHERQDVMHRSRMSGADPHPAFSKPADRFRQR